MTDQLTNAGKSSKAYWSILKSFLNNLRWCRARDLFGSQIPVTTGGFQLRISCIRSSYLIHQAKRKIPLIPPLFYENFFITNFKEKVELLISFFADRCLSYASQLPSNFMLYTDNRLSTVTFPQHDIGKIIQNLNRNKGQDNVSNRMLEICRSSIMDHENQCSNKL